MLMRPIPAQQPSHANPGAVDHAKKPALLRAFVLAVVMSAVADAEGYAATVRPW